MAFLRTSPSNEQRQGVGLTMMSTDRLIKAIQEQFRGDRPNGFILDWNRNRFFDEIRKVARSCEVTNCTDFNYSFCNCFHVKRNIDRNVVSAGASSVVLRISFIADVFSIHVVRRTRGGKGAVVLEEQCPELSSVLCRLRCFLQQSAFHEIDEKQYDQIVEHVLPELSDVATIGKCLFDDYY